MADDIKNTVKEGGQAVKNASVGDILWGVAGVGTGAILTRTLDPAGRIAEKIADATSQNGEPVLTEKEADFFGWIAMAILDISIAAGAWQVPGGVRWYGAGFAAGSLVSSAFN